MVRFVFFFIFAITAFVIYTIVNSIFRRNRISSNKQRNQKINYESPEKSIVKLAKEHNNKITIIDVIRETSLTSKQAEDTLKDLASRGLAEVDVKESGTVVYVFRDVDSVSNEDNI